MGATRRSLITLLLLTAAACTVRETDAPPLTGPSELALRIKLDAIPDSLLQDGLSQSLIQIEATNADGRPARGLPLRIDVVFDGTIQDFGTLSSKTVVTGDDGRARVTYTAPPRPGQPTDTFNVITVRATPVGTDFRGEVARTVDLRLIPPGVIQPPNAAPEPAFSFTPPAPEVLTNVVFDASESKDEGQLCGPACSYSWEFGDGSTGSGIFASHQYRNTGTFQVRLTVTDARGASASLARAITIGRGTPPTASFTFSPTTPSPGQPIFFTAEASRAAAGRQIVAYDWNFGSGATASGVTTSKSYSAPGIYNVTLTVTDDAGQQATDTKAVAVAVGAAPTASFTFSPTAPAVGQTIFLTAEASRAAPGRRIVSYQWNFGSGAGASGVTTTTSYGTAGTYNVTLTVTDDAGTQGTISQAIPVGTGGGGSGPQAILQVTPATGTTLTSFTFDASSSHGPQPIEDYSFRLSDGRNSAGRTSSWTATFPTPGTYTVTLTVTDSAKRTATDTKTVIVQ